MSGHLTHESLPISTGMRMHVRPPGRSWPACCLCPRVTPILACIHASLRSSMLPATQPVVRRPAKILPWPFPSNKQTNQLPHLRRRKAGRTTWQQPTGIAPCCELWGTWAAPRPPPPSGAEWPTPACGCQRCAGCCSGRGRCQRPCTNAASCGRRGGCSRCRCCCWTSNKAQWEWRRRRRPEWRREPQRERCQLRREEAAHQSAMVPGRRWWHMRDHRVRAGTGVGCWLAWLQRQWRQHAIACGEWQWRQQGLPR